METFITIYTKWFLNWGQTENAMIFILTGVTASLRYFTNLWKWEEGKNREKKIENFLDDPFSQKARKSAVFALRTVHFLF